MKLIKLIAYNGSSFKQKEGFFLVFCGRGERFPVQAKRERVCLLTLPFNLGEVWRLFFPVNIEVEPL